MTSEPIEGNAKLLRGKIVNLRKKRCRRDFFFTDSDRARMGATAIAAGLAGLGGVAAGLGSMSMDTAEEADLVEFEIDSKPIRAWLWISVFQEGDDVEVVAEPDGDIWMGYGIRRISDGVVGVRPTCRSNFSGLRLARCQKHRPTRNNQKDQEAGGRRRSWDFVLPLLSPRGLTLIFFVLASGPKPHGPRSSLRKVTFIGPALIRPDRLGLT